MAGVRKIREIAEDTVKLTILVPKDVDRRLRALAASRRGGVGPIVREWIMEKLREAEPDTARSATKTRRANGVHA
jgi:hypothetical protein